MEADQLEGKWKVHAFYSYFCFFPQEVKTICGVGRDFHCCYTFLSCDFQSSLSSVINNKYSEHDNEVIQVKKKGITAEMKEYQWKLAMSVLMPYLCSLKLRDLLLP